MYLKQAIDGVVAGRVDVLTDTQAIELVYLKSNKFHEDIGQALYYGDVTGQQKLEYVSGLCAAHGIEV